MLRLLELGGVHDVTRRYIEVGGSRLHFLDLGAGPVLVLLQGAGGGCANWFRVLAPLARHFRVLVPDLPGFGLSSPIPPRPPLGAHGAGVMKEWLDAVGIERVAMMATSFGGLIALRFAQSWPERLERVVLMDVVGLGSELPWPVRLAGLPLLARIAATTSRFGTRLMFRRLLTSDRSGIPPEHQEALVEYIYRSSRAADPRVTADSYRAFAGLGGQREVLSDAELRALPQPLLLVWGETDGFLPRSHAERAATLAPRAELRLIAGAGHSPNWEAPEAVLDAVRPFLEAGTPQGSTP